jgi:hypothetical protein
MPENYQQPIPKTSAGYRPLAPVDLSRTAFNPAYACIVAAAGAGMLVGLGIAVTAGVGNVAATQRVSSPPVAQASGLPTLQASYTGPATSLLSVVDPSKKANAGTPKFSPSSGLSVKKAADSHKRHGLSRLWPWKKGSAKQDSAKRKPYVSPNAPPSPEEPTALELASAAAATGPMVLGIQGDATVANYDVATGTIETREGSSFVLDKTTSESSAIPWEDFPFNVHYRCDQNSNCTMVSRGATANARIMR